MKYIVPFLFILGSLSCQQTQVKEELQKVKSELSSAKEMIEQLQSQLEPQGELVHLVFLKLKADVEMTTLVNELKKLSTIEGIKDFEVGPFQDLGDARALSEYDVLMEMSFDNETAYQKYQADSVHQTVKENLKSFLAGPPATYDYLKQ